MLNEADPSPCTDRARTRRKRAVNQTPCLLDRYTDGQGRSREVLTRQGAGGSVLVVDRDSATRGDRRLVAHLAADEPVENAALVCSHYLEDARGAHGRCRRVSAQDTRLTPFADEQEPELALESSASGPEAVDGCGCRYRLELVESGMSIPELRWCRHGPERASAGAEQVSLRTAVACLESYEPVRTLTLRALAHHRRYGTASTTVLRAELDRMQNSPIVLNRRLREVVLARTEREELSMSEIAIRCGRIKRDCRGNESGETSWLARRLGLLPEGGQSTPTPWIHSDVLALVARRGLGMSPREVELG
jgi:hypothetical protein